jgi:hypothetical protein
MAGTRCARVGLRDGLFSVASVYLHLNPVRVSDLGLGKSQNRAEARGLRSPSKAETASRLKTLKSHHWSSYLTYAGYSTAPKWLTTRSILARAGYADLREVGNAEISG